MTKESQHKGTIFVDYLCNEKFLSSRRGKKIINEHMLLGWLAHQNLELDETMYHMSKAEFKRQWHLNQCYQELLAELSKDFKAESISPILLKGTVLLSEVYKELGSRSMSDIDILIKKEELPIVLKILQKKGFKEHKHKKWKANSHKVELVRITNGIELVIELHTSLLYHSEEPNWVTKDFELTPYKTLAPEDFLFFQCTHLGFQHSFLKLFWILDIHYWLTMNQELDQELILKKAKKHKVYNSLIFTLYILEKYFNTPIEGSFKKAITKVSPVKKMLFTSEFLIEPKKNMAKYLLIKHLCKDSLKESLAYDLGWIRDKLSRS